MPKLPISVLILTKNEEINMKALFESVSWSDDIHVLDSHSTDSTVEMAKAAGAHVLYRDIDDAAIHQNWALRNIPYKYDWVFHIDADERTTPELVEALKQVVDQPVTHVSYNVQRRDFFMQTWLKHTQSTPHYQRFFLHEKMKYDRKVHPIPVPDGTVGFLKGYLDHYPFSKGISQWYSRHNLYSTWEADILTKAKDEDDAFSLKEMLFGASMQVKRRQMKKLYFMMPFRPQIKFFYMYILKGGFLDGRAGYTYARLIFFYESMITLKVYERKNGV